MTGRSIGHMINAIRRLEQLDLRYTLDGTGIDIVWFRALCDSNTESGYWHAHTTPEIHYMFAEDLTVLFDDGAVAIQPGQALLIGPGINHSLQGVDARARIRFVLSFWVAPAAADDEMKWVADVLSLNRSHLFSVTDALEGLFMACLTEAVDRKPGFLSAIKGNLLSILIQTARQIASETARVYRVPTRQNFEDHRAERILEYIEREALCNIRLADVAKYMNLSEKQVQRIVSGRYGTSIHRMMMDVKLRMAKEMMKSPEVTLEQIASSLGFASEQYFSRFFRKLEGMPPNRYRKSIIP